MQSLKLGIGDLVDFCCRDGDLGYDDTPGIRAMQGLRTHQRIQRQYASEADAEVSVTLTLEIDDYRIELGGRIDLLFSNERPVRIEEIKTVHSHSREDAMPPAGEGAHWAQLRCYGACYASAHELDRVSLSLNRVSLFAQAEQRQTREYNRDELIDFVESIVRQYLDWHRLLTEKRDHVRQQARQLDFPFADFRPQQRGFAAEVYRATREGQRLTVEAPTGSGKTISTLFPALKALGDAHCDQVVYLSAKRSGQQQAIDALERMPTGASYVTIQAKARACPCLEDTSEVDADGRCRRCLGFFERLPEAREQLLQQGQLDREQIQATAQEFTLCPFELSLQMLPWVDVVICDFNYVFDPLVQLGYFRDNARRKLLLIDECHNLVERARDMYSARLARAQTGAALAADNGQAVRRALRRLQHSLDQSANDCSDDETVDAASPDYLLRACQRFTEDLGADFFGNRLVPAETVELLREVVRFHSIGQIAGEHHRALISKPLSQRQVRLVCLNAHAFLASIYPLFHAVCGFSATLTPTHYFRQALGLEADSRALVLDPAFPPQHLGLRVATHIDTRYRQREQHIDDICDAIAITYAARPGNYLVFFSSYAFMQQVHTRFDELHPGIDVLVQQRDDDDAAQQAFIRRYFEANEQLGFVIMGGRFAEGIDYRGDALIGAIIVGTGLPQPSLNQRLIQQDFDDSGMDGFDFAFRFPGLIRVKQSAGRVIRSEQDRGVIVLLERRFRYPDYARELPAWWQVEYCNDARSLEQSLQGFWEQQDAAD